MDGTVFWITGLSGAGKTTVGKVLYSRIREKKENVAFLDGDVLRAIFGGDLGYGKEDRFQSAMRNARISHLLASQGIDVVCCTISMFEDVRRWNRENNRKYIEVYLNVPIKTLRERNQKNLYVEAEDELVGIGIGMEAPICPDMEVVNDGERTPEDIAEEIMRKAGYVG